MSERESDMERVSGFKREREGTVNVYERERERERERESFFTIRLKSGSYKFPKLFAINFASGDENLERIE